MEAFPADLPIVDPHHHLWDIGLNYYPWLTDQITKRVCGEYSAIRKNYLIGDFLADLDGLPVIATVHEEAVHDRADPVRETCWLSAVADAPDAVNPRHFPNGIVAYCDLARRDAPRMLDAHAAYSRLRGVRQMLHEAMVDPDKPAAPLYENPLWRQNLREVSRRGLNFDIQLYPEQMDDGYTVVKSEPELQFVLCHTGQPLDRTDEGIAAWKRGMRRLASLPNIAVKISGLGMFDRTWTVDTIRPFVLDTIDIFGAHRAMFASNFPVDGMMTTYRRLWCAYEAITRGFSDAERRLLFAGNAQRIYRV
ncbi:amidohydrolase family protein [Acuticoccus kandeliae]|uniref:amidohydrolase family protein n=1 Tax=Acuticoccus kandeliae TaxID=2073160 RepID=UPI000D3EA009|nr:amidohydrolase family protein [Acuticoccus kandeliae]